MPMTLKTIENYRDIIQAAYRLAERAETELARISTAAANELGINAQLIKTRRMLDTIADLGDEAGSAVRDRIIKLKTK